MPIVRFKCIPIVRMKEEKWSTLSCTRLVCLQFFNLLDISNAARPWEICKKWSDMIVEEFFLQGEQEKRMGIPISPSMDRETTSPAKIGIQFNDLIARPYFEALGDILDPMECFVENCQANRMEWISRMEITKEISAGAAPDSPEIASVKASLSRGRRMSTAAGTISIPVSIMSRSLPPRQKRHRYIHAHEFILILYTVSVPSHLRQKTRRRSTRFPSLLPRPIPFRMID